ncbi:MAG TPA: hypothetical protein PLO63_00005, partial [Syntrophales bacterium]|nr:hypothetical protein [Syntrophales bacterium]
MTERAASDGPLFRSVQPVERTIQPEASSRWIQNPLSNTPTQDKLLSYQYDNPISPAVRPSWHAFRNRVSQTKQKTLR